MNAEMLHEENRCRQHVDEEAGEVERECGAGEEEGGRGQDLPVAPAQVAGAQGLAFVRWQGFRQQFPAGKAECAGGEYEEAENRTPAEQGLQPAADDRGDGRGNGEHHGDLRHQALSRRAVEEVADDGAADHDAGAGSDALHGAPEPELLDAGGKGTARRGEPEQGEGDEDDAAPAKAVGNGAVPQGHHGEGEQVDRERLLDFKLAGAELGRDIREGRQVGVDRERAERR